MAVVIGVQAFAFADGGIGVLAARPDLVAIGGVDSAPTAPRAATPQGA